MFAISPLHSRVSGADLTISPPSMPCRCHTPAVQLVMSNRRTHGNSKWTRGGPIAHPPSHFSGPVRRFALHPRQYGKGQPLVGTDRGQAGRRQSCDVTGCSPALLCICC